jgi:ferritin-like metal-binding protein YciE
LLFPNPRDFPLVAEHKEWLKASAPCLPGAYRRQYPATYRVGDPHLSLHSVVGRSSSSVRSWSKHESETEEHVERLDKVFAQLDARPSAKTLRCHCWHHRGRAGSNEGSPALDAGLLAAAQAVEHYEISRYGTLKTWAQELGLEEAVELLDTTLAEEKKTDEVLTEIAESSVNQHAEAA